jgi:hypothetical protein
MLQEKLAPQERENSSKSEDLRGSTIGNASLFSWSYLITRVNISVDIMVVAGGIYLHV